METRDKLSTTAIRCKDACYIPTSLPPEPSSILHYLSCRIQALDTKRPVVSFGKAVAGLENFKGFFT